MSFAPRGSIIGTTFDSRIVVLFLTLLEGKDGGYMHTPWEALDVLYLMKCSFLIAIWMDETCILTHRNTLCMVFAIQVLSKI